MVFETVNTAYDNIKYVCEREYISVSLTKPSDVDHLHSELNSIDNLNVCSDDLTSFGNKQMGIQFEKSAMQTYK